MKLFFEFQIKALARYQGNNYALMFLLRGKGNHYIYIHDPVCHFKIPKVEPQEEHSSLSGRQNKLRFGGVLVCKNIF
jgi:hypothetical protein